MERRELRREPDLTVQVLHTEAGVQIRIVLSEGAVKFLEDIANRRGNSIEGIVGEGLRLERLLVEGELLYAKRHWWGHDNPRGLLGA